MDYHIQMPFVNFNEIAELFVDEFYQFSESHPEYQLASYGSILESNGLHWNDEEMRNADLDSLDDKSILALIMGAICAERFCDGALLVFFKDGFIMKWLKRLKDIDDIDVTAQINEIYFEIGGFQGYDSYHIICNDNRAVIITNPWCEAPFEKQYSSAELAKLFEDFNMLHVEYWNSDYIDNCICDGTQWQLVVKYNGQHDIVWEGSNAYPNNWDDLLSFFGIDYE